jgi:hypothetical protein
MSLTVEHLFLNPIFQASRKPKFRLRKGGKKTVENKIADEVRYAGFKINNKTT